VDLDALPVSHAAIATFGQKVAEQHALAGGDDYELLFTVANENLLSLESAIAGVAVTCTPIGRIMADGGVQSFRRGERVIVDAAGFDHFSRNR
jgi:thiamine-monophosphate kinase